jgi:pimeloyl-ACP methyl ester carboxylesterase
MTAPLRSQTMALPRTRGGICYAGRAGEGPAIVLLHGIGSNADSFAPVFERMSPRYRLIAWNAPGYGGSSALEQDWPSAHDYARALEGFLDDLGITSCCIVGHSLGTLIAAAFAQANPQRVSHLVLAACAQGYGVSDDKDMPPSVAKRITDLKSLGPDVFAKTRAARLVYAPDQAPDVVAQVEAAMAQVNPLGYAQAVRMLAGGDLAATMAQVKTPCSFIVGAQDVVTPEAQTIAAAQAWAGPRAMPAITRIAEAGHAVYIQKPDAFVSALQEALSSAANPIGDLK